MKPNSFYLRHFFTGKVISLKNVKVKNNDEVEKRVIPCLKDSNEQVQFISTAGGNSNFMDNNSCFLIAINGKQLVVDSNLKYTIKDTEPTQH